MTFVAPLALALAALAVPILILYMLRSRRARTPVSSTLLWDLGPRTVHANAPWQPLRMSVLLLLQLLILALLVLAVARPARRTAVPLAEHTVLIVDTSASMQAVDGGTSRLEHAKERALDAVSQLGPGKRMSVIDAGPQARVVLSGSSDRRALVEAINGLRATDGTTDAAGAFALGASLETADVPTILHFYSDGGLRPEDRATSPAALVHVPVGSGVGNVAVQRVSLAEGGAGWDAFARLANTGSSPADATLVLRADDAEVARQAVRLEPGTERDLTLSLPATDARVLTASLADVRPSGGSTGDAARVNALATDDAAAATFERGDRVRVLLMTPGNVFLESLFGSLPGAEVTVSKTRAPARTHTLAVYDRVAPPARLEVPSIVIAPPADAPGVTVGGRLPHPVVTFVAPREPVVERADLSRLAIRRAQQARAPAMRTLVGAGDDPLLAIGVPGGVRMAYLAFDLRDSNLPVQVAFPLVFGNLVTWLARGDAPDRGALVAGDPLPLSLPGSAERFEVRTPDGTAPTRPTTRALFDDTARAGVYHVRYLGRDGTVGEEVFAVGVPDVETDLAPRQIVGRSFERGPGSALAGLRTFGPGILAAALAVLLLEWWWAHGRPSTRARGGRRRAPHRRAEGTA